MFYYKMSWQIFIVACCLFIYVLMDVETSMSSVRFVLLIPTIFATYVCVVTSTLEPRKERVFKVSEENN